LHQAPRRQVSTPPPRASITSLQRSKTKPTARGFSPIAPTPVVKHNPPNPPPAPVRPSEAGAPFTLHVTAPEFDVHLSALPRPIATPSAITAIQSERLPIGYDQHVSEIRLGATASATDTMTLRGSDLTVDRLIIGDAGRGLVDLQQG